MGFGVVTPPPRSCALSMSLCGLAETISEILLKKKKMTLTFIKPAPKHVMCLLLKTWLLERCPVGLIAILLLWPETSEQRPSCRLRQAHHFQGLLKQSLVTC